MNPAKQIQMAIIEADLQQGWACLEGDKFPLAAHHFDAAAQKARDMETTLKPLAEAKPAAEQKTLDIPNS